MTEIEARSRYWIGIIVRILYQLAILVALWAAADHLYYIDLGLNAKPSDQAVQKPVDPKDPAGLFPAKPIDPRELEIMLDGINIKLSQIETEVKEIHAATIDRN